MPKCTECVLVVAQQAVLRAALARLVLPLGYRVEIASTQKRVRELIHNEHFAAAIIGPMPLSAIETAFLRELQNGVQRLVVLTDGPKAVKGLVASFPDALICTVQPLDETKVVAFLGRPDMKRSSCRESPVELLHFAGCTLDVAGHAFVNADRQQKTLTRAEFALLVVFARNPGRVLSRARLRGAMDNESSGATEAYDRSIDMLIARLRRKIEPNAAKPQFIATVPGAGYKFVPHVRRSESAEQAMLLPTRIADDYALRRAERRQVTILSCQIVGFAALASKLDPEDLQKMIGPVDLACTEVIGRFGGTVVRALGDGVLAFFGHPRANENDAESAVRAALELLRAIRGISATPLGSFRARIGIATGLVVVGELQAGAEEMTAVGEALNLALHMQRAAPTDSAVIATSTQELIGRFFQCQSIEPIELEEGYEPVPAWRVVGETAWLPRFDALRRDGMLDLVGRDSEVMRLRQCWFRVRDRGTGEIVMVSGEAGIGKSRLVIEFQETLQCEPHAEIRYFGLPHRALAPMSVLIDEVQSSAGFLAADSTTQKLEKVRNIFARLGSMEMEATALVADLLGLSHEGRSSIGQLSPQRRKDRIFASLLARIEAIAAQQPILVLVEDIHWVDPTSLEFFTLLVERAATLRLLLVAVARPEFVVPWPDHSYVTRLTLSRLSQSDSTLLVNQVAGERHVPASVEASILARADGVPLFVEELTRSVLESAPTNGGDGVSVVSDPRAVLIPATLQGLLFARLDRLDRGKQVAQIGAVIGRDFSFELMRIVSRMDAIELAAALDQLVVSGLVFCRGPRPQATFVFKHALVRDAAYNMLLRGLRQTLHGAVAQAYEQHFPEITEMQPELLAYHLKEARELARAVCYLLAAAERALHSSAAIEALSLLTQARDLISELPEDSGRLESELRLELALARAFLATRGYTAIETRQSYQRARERCEALNDQSSLPLIIHGQWLGAWISADHQSALERARELYSWGQGQNDQIGFAVGHADVGMTLTTLGRFVEARYHLDQALEINKFVAPGRQPFVASNADGRISALSFMHNCLLLLGFPDQAEAVANEAANLIPDNLYARGLAQLRILRMRVIARDALGVAAIGTELARVGQEQGYPHLVGTAMVYTGWATAQRGEIASGIDTCERGLSQLGSIGAKCWLPLHLAMLAECYARAGDREHCFATAAQALQTVEESDERFWETELYRLKGRLLLDVDTKAAAKCFETALDKARVQQAKLLELRAAMSLADLLVRIDQPDRARDVLAPIYGSFTEGFNFIDLREANALLATLEG
jgi:class 3 adenylate cyclase/DNA-binding response OmpR family regulator/tetratricopeptide (TPR) repeat protein